MSIFGRNSKRASERRDSAEPQSEPLADPAPADLADTFTERELEREFWPKLKRVAAVVPGVSEILALYFYMKSPDAGLQHRVSILATLAYFILPFDAIPDFIAGIGYTDDLAIAMGLIKFIGSETMNPYRLYARQWLRNEHPPAEPMIQTIRRLQSEQS